MNKHVDKNVTQCRRQAGIGLIELMISITLGLFLISGAVGVFISSKSTQGFNTELSWIQDNARFTMATLTRDIRMAGYFGCSSSQNTTNTVNSGSEWYLDFNIGVEGWDGSESFPTGFPSAYNSNAASGLPNSDLITIRSASETELRIDRTPSINSVNLQLFDDHPFEVGDILVASDCEQTSIFQMTASTASHVVVHNTGAGSPGNCTHLLAGAGCTGVGPQQGHLFDSSNGATISQIKSYGYFVDLADDGSPALFRREMYGNSGSANLRNVELVQGVENIQVVYGHDSNDDDYADHYIDATDVTSSAMWEDVVAVRLHVLFRSYTETATEPLPFRFVNATYTPNDRFFRQEFISTIELRNK